MPSHIITIESNQEQFSRWLEGIKNVFPLWDEIVGIDVYRYELISFPQNNLWVIARLKYHDNINEHIAKFKIHEKQGEDYEVIIFKTQVVNETKMMVRIENYKKRHSDGQIFDFVAKKLVEAWRPEAAPTQTKAKSQTPTPQKEKGGHPHNADYDNVYGKMQSEKLTTAQAFEYYLKTYRPDLIGKLSFQKRDEKEDVRKRFESAMSYRRKKETQKTPI